jgi:SAM-dependent methyltransferase
VSLRSFREVPTHRGFPLAWCNAAVNAIQAARASKREGPGHMESIVLNPRGIVRKAATMILPDRLKSALGYRYREYSYLKYLKRKFGHRFKRCSVGPVAPPELIETEALMNADELKTKAKPEWYFGGGRREAWSILNKVEQQGGDIMSMRAVLEFGCGSARVLRHFRYIDGLRLAGTDANPKAIEWDRKNLPGIEFNHNQLQPPLPYEDESFDLIYALSVFTHIPLAWQRSWLDELRRMLRAGGYLLCTLLGEHFVNSMLNDEDRNKLQRDGHLILDAKSARASYSTQVLGSWDIFQSQDEVRAVFGKNLELLSYEAATGPNQDTLVLRKSTGAGANIRASRPGLAA